MIWGLDTFLALLMQHKNDKSGVNCITRFRRALNKSAVINTLWKVWRKSFYLHKEAVLKQTTQLTKSPKWICRTKRVVCSSLLPIISLPLMNCTLSANHRPQLIMRGRSSEDGPAAVREQRRDKQTHTGEKEQLTDNNNSIGHYTVSDHCANSYPWT